MTGTSVAFATLSASFFDRQVSLHERILDEGERSGAFRLAGDAIAVARALVALEDGLGLQVVLGHPALDSAAAKEILLVTAAAVTAPPSPGAGAR